MCIKPAWSIWYIVFVYDFRVDWLVLDNPLGGTSQKNYFIQPQHSLVTYSSLSMGGAL